MRLSSEIVSLNPRWVIIEGGEPLLCKKLFEALEIIHKNSIKIYLISNGMLLDEDIVMRLKCLDVNLMISIEGADKESYEKTRIGASFEKLKQSVAIANKHNILSACPVTIGKYNYEQIGKLFKLAEEIGYRKFIFLGLKPCKDYKKYGMSKIEYEKFFFSVIKHRGNYKIDVSVDEPFFGPFLRENKIDWLMGDENGIIVPDVSSCIFGEYIFIETDGNVKPCTFAPLVMGNVREKPLPLIWDEIQKSELIKMIKDPRRRKGQCGTCKYLARCGGCRVRTFSLTEDWTESDPSCPIISNYASIKP